MWNFEKETFLQNQQPSIPLGFDRFCIGSGSGLDMKWVQLPYNFYRSDIEVEKWENGPDWKAGISDNPGDICDDRLINISTLDRSGPKEGMEIIDQDGVYFHLNSTHASIT